MYVHMTWKKKQSSLENKGNYWEEQAGKESEHGDLLRTHYMLSYSMCFKKETSFSIRSRIETRVTTYD